MSTTQTIDSFCPPFGMVMPGRNWTAATADGYGFGFNGKMNDNDISGSGNVYDYGFRIYNPRIAKFLSVDPLTEEYPGLTPYQFASNRPIDGIDLDGLEYITYIIDIYSKTGACIVKVIDYRGAKEFNYSRYSESFGSEGRGVKFVYNYYDSEGNLQFTDDSWQQKQDGFESKNEFHGFFNGGGAVSTLGDNELFPITFIGANVYNFSIKPIDMADAIAREHDLEEKEANYTTWKDVDYIFADIRLVKRAKMASQLFKQDDYVDPYTNKPASREAKRAVWNQGIYFKHEIRAKEKAAKGYLKNGTWTKEQYNSWKSNVDKAWSEEVDLPTD